VLSETSGQPDYAPVPDQSVSLPPIDFKYSGTKVSPMESAPNRPESKESDKSPLDIINVD